jgi:hypothetical protein
VFGYALDCNYASGYLDVANRTYIGGFDRDRWITAWVRSPNTGAGTDGQGIIKKAGQWTLSFEGQALQIKLIRDESPGSTKLVGAGDGLTLLANTWYFVTVEYIDGDPLGTITLSVRDGGGTYTPGPSSWTRQPPNSTGEFRIGYNQAGLIDEVVIGNGTLTASQKDILYNSGVAGLIT